MPVYVFYFVLCVGRKLTRHYIYQAWYYSLSSIAGCY